MENPCSRNDGEKTLDMTPEEAVVFKIIKSVRDRYKITLSPDEIRIVGLPKSVMVPKNQTVFAYEADINGITISEPIAFQNNSDGSFDMNNQIGNIMSLPF